MTKARDLASATPVPSAVSATELGYVDGVTSSIQTQVDSKLATTTASSTYIPKTLTTTTGDVIYASGANTPARLGIGSTGNVLTVSGGVPTWAAPASGGGMTLIASGSLGTSNSVDINSISQSYKDLKIYIKGAQASADFYYGIRLNADTGANYSFNLFTNNSTTAFISTYQGQDYTYSSAHELNGAQYFTVYDIYDYTNSTTRKSYRFQQDGLIYDSSFKTESFGFGQWHPSTPAAVTSLTIRCNTSVNFSAGTYEVYGVK